MQNHIQEAIALHRLPASFESTVSRWYQPLAEKIAHKAKASEACLVVGIQGTQGSGKSTLADFLRTIFLHQYSLNCAILSIDDFYLTRAERIALSESTHPLLKTRGVPGTHDVALAVNTINALSALKTGQRFAPVRFNKATDDRAAEDTWASVTGPVDIVILEGWCVGLPPQSPEALSTAVNTLESNEDPDGNWRSYVNQQLSQHYPALFSLLDCLAVLKAPSFECVYNWRVLQEQKLEESWKKLPEAEKAASRILTPEEIKRFISHYQRLTEHALNCLPDKADWVLPLGEDHTILDLICN